MISINKIAILVIYFSIVPFFAVGQKKFTFNPDKCCFSNTPSEIRCKGTSYIIEKPPSTKAISTVQEILRVSGVNIKNVQQIGSIPGFKLLPNACVDNAAAQIDNSGFKIIWYNEYWMEGINILSNNEWGKKLTLAHEIAHHYNSESALSVSKGREFELAADHWAGHVLYNLGATKISQIEEACLAFDEKGKGDHPSRSERKAEVLRGWTIAKARHDAAQAEGVDEVRKRQNKRARKISLSIGAGVSFPNKKFYDKDIVNGNQWQEDGYFANSKALIPPDICVRYNFNRFLGVGAGTMVMFKSVNNAALENQITFFLSKNAISTQSVSVQADQHKMLIPYISPITITLRMEEYSHFLSLEPIVAWVSTSNPILGNANEMQLNIRYKNGEQQNEKISFKTGAFPMYGGKVNLALGLDDAGQCRILLSAYYMSGNYNFPLQQISFQNLPSKLTFQGYTQTLGGISLGLHFTISADND